LEEKVGKSRSNLMRRSINENVEEAAAPAPAAAAENEQKSIWAKSKN